MSTTASHDDLAHGYDDEQQPLLLHSSADRGVKRASLAKVLPGLLIGVAVAAADNTITFAIVSTIGSEFGELSRVSWVGTSYLIAVTIAQPCYGRFSVIFGPRISILISSIFYLVGCFWCSTARSMNELIAARAMTGIGGGGLTSLTSIIISQLVSLRSRGTFQGAINLIFATGSAMGSTIGGTFADSSLGWRFSFLWQPPLMIVACICTWVTLKDLPRPDEKETTKNRLLRVDYGGILCLIIATTSLLIGLDMAGNKSWQDTKALVLIGVGLLFFVTFAVIELKFAKEPIAPGAVVLARTPLASYISNFFSFMGQFALLFYLPLYFQITGGESSTAAATHLLPLIVAGSTGSLLGILIMHKTAKYFWITIFAYLLSTLSLFFISTTWNAFTPLWISTLMLASEGLGNGIGVTSLLIAIIASVGNENQAIGISVSYLFRALGTVIGIALASAIVQADLRHYLSFALSGREAEEIAENVRKSLDFLEKLDPDIRDVVIFGYGKAMRLAFGFAAICMALALVSSFFMREHSLKT